MTKYMKSILTIFALTAIISAQPYNIGDVISDFSSPICANGSGNLNLYDYFGDQNGGEYHVIWINFFTSW